MKKTFCVFAFLLFSLTSCTVTTLSPAAASPREITAAAVNLPFDGNTAAAIKYMPCYINTGTGFRAAYVFYFNDFSSDVTIHIVAPAGGLVVYMAHSPDPIGQNIVVKTDFVYQKERVYYQLTRFHEMASGLSAGNRIDQGDTIGYIDNDGHPFDPINGYIVDLAFFVAKPSLYDNDPGNSANIEKYLDPDLMLGDDLENFYLIYHMPQCTVGPVITP
jgi:hypothetical protein